MTTAVSDRDRELLRRLAGEVRRIADLPEMAQRKRRLSALNALRPERPIVLCFPEGAWEELLPASVCQCADSPPRDWELALRRRVYWWEHIHDDNAVEPWFEINWAHQRGDYGVHVQTTRSEARGSYVWEPPIRDLEADFGKLRRRPLSVDRAETRRQLDLANALFGDLLPTRLGGSFFWTMGITQDVIHLIGLEQLMVAMIDQPAALHRLMAWMRDEHLAMLDWYESQGLFNLNNRNGYVGSGGVAYTDELPQEDWQPGRPVRTIDMWGFAESQETVGVSPAMFAEFILPYQLPLLSRFGLNAYGCCEPVHQRWAHIRTIPRLRRVSISPWCDQKLCAEQMGGRFVFSRKPNPAPVCMGADESVIRQDLRDTLDIAGRLPLEIILKDTHTVQNQPRRITRWVAIALEEVQRQG